MLQYQNKDKIEIKESQDQWLMLCGKTFFILYEVVVNMCAVVYPA